MFRYNDADVHEANGRKMPFGLMCDQFAESKGYLAVPQCRLEFARARRLGACRRYCFGTLKKRHGAILPITAAEYDAVEAAFAL